MQQTIYPAKNPVNANVLIPGSKSMTYRALFLATLANGVSEISGLLINDQTRRFINSLHELGIVIQLDESTHSCIVAGGNGKLPKKQASLWCDENNIAAKLLLGLCATTPGVYYFDGPSSLHNRFTTQLLHTLIQQGAQLIPGDSKKMPFTLIGCNNLTGGDVTIDSHLSTQIISTLLMLAPNTQRPFHFIAPSPIHRPLIDITCAMMTEFGVLVQRTQPDQISIPVPQRYSARDYYIEPDLAIAAYFFAAAAATGGQVTMQPINLAQTKQAYAKFFLYLEKMGCQVQETNAGLTVLGPKQLQGIEISMREFSDAMLAIIAIAPFAATPTHIAHIGHLRPPEAHLIHLIKTEFTKLGIQIETNDDSIQILPSMPKGCAVSAHHNTHIAMALSLLGLKTPEVMIDDVSCVINHYADFFIEWRALSQVEKMKV